MVAIRPQKYDAKQCRAPSRPPDCHFLPGIPSSDPEPTFIRSTSEMRITKPMTRGNARPALHQLRFQDCLLETEVRRSSSKKFL
jgi:hypothetical protein